MWQQTHHGGARGCYGLRPHRHTASSRAVQGGKAPQPTVPGNDAVGLEIAPLQKTSGTASFRPAPHTVTERLPLHLVSGAYMRYNKKDYRPICSAVGAGAAIFLPAAALRAGFCGFAFQQSRPRTRACPLRPVRIPDRRRIKPHLEMNLWVNILAPMASVGRPTST